MELWKAIWFWTRLRSTLVFRTQNLRCHGEERHMQKHIGFPVTEKPLCFVTLLVLSVLLRVASSAQAINNKTNIGLPENGVFDGSSFDNVQLTNGNLHIELPLWSYSGRGLPISFKYVYDNKGWYIENRCTRTGFCTDTVKREIGNNMILRLLNP